MSHHTITSAMTAERNRTRTTEVARTRVAPIIGMDSAMRMDHAHSLYREALKTMGYDTAGVSNEGMASMFDMATQIATREASPASRMSPAAPDSDSPLAGLSARRKA